MRGHGRGGREEVSALALHGGAELPPFFWPVEASPPPPHLAMSWCPAIRRVFPLGFFTSPPSLLLPRRFASSLPKLYLSPHLLLGSCSHVIRLYRSTVQNSDLESKVNRIVEGLTVI